MSDHYDSHHSKEEPDSKTTKKNKKTRHREKEEDNDPAKVFTEKDKEGVQPRVTGPDPIICNEDRCVTRTRSNKEMRLHYYFVHKLPTNWWIT